MSPAPEICPSSEGECILTGQHNADTRLDGGKEYPNDIAIAYPTTTVFVHLTSIAERVTAEHRSIFNKLLRSPQDGSIPQPAVLALPSGSSSTGKPYLLFDCSNHDTGLGVNKTVNLLSQEKESNMVAQFRPAARAESR